jgi:hypothetical protein
MTTWTVKKAQADAPAADPANPAAPAAAQQLPDKFGMRVGALAILNFMRTIRYSGAAAHGVDVNALARDLMTKAQMSVPGGGPAGPATQLPTYNLNDEDFKTLIREAGGADSLSVLPDSIDPLFASIKDSGQFEDTSVEDNRKEALQVNPPPPGGEGTGPWAPPLWQSVENAFATAVRSSQKAMQKNIPGAQQTYLPAWSKKRKVLAGPLAEGRYQSLEDLKQDLIGLGPKSETYDSLLGVVGQEREDSAKDALTKFFQGDASALSFLYDLLVGVGLASPIDTELVERVMEQNPGMADENKTATAGLFLPPADSGLNTRQQKVAGGGVGGADSGHPAYIMYGGGENRMCPKLRNVVSTFICRYHCLDGLAIDDAQVVCGEAIWRQAVMDKFSREYKDKDGNWVGGYLNKRFEINRDTGGHPYQLKPGQRRAPINEDAWSPEKRLQEMRRSESGKRNYAETPGDPEGLYNFDQHDLAKGPRNPGLSEKRKDPIAKIASASRPVVKTSMWDDGPMNVDQLAQQDPREFVDEPVEDESRTMRILGFVDRNRPRWDSDEAFKDAVRSGDPASSQGLSPDELAEAVKMLEQPGQPAQPAGDVVAKSTGFNLRKMAINPGGDPLKEKGKAGKVAEKCPKCGGTLAPGAKACQNCGPVQPGQGIQYSEALSATRTFPGAEASSSAEVVVANGVYRASRNDKSAYGETAKEAQSKLDRLLDPGSVQEESEELLKIRQGEPGTGQPAAVPAAPAGTEPVVDPTPSTREVPPGVEQPVAPEIQGGKSELGPPDIDPMELDRYLATASSNREDDDDTEQIAEASALGPDA